MGGFEFDDWRFLAENDPAAFFRARERTLRQFITQHPDQRDALGALQMRIDTARAMSGTPQQACRDLFGLLEEHLLLLSERLADLRREATTLQRMLGVGGAELAVESPSVRGHS